MNYPQTNSFSNGIWYYMYGISRILQPNISLCYAGPKLGIHVKSTHWEIPRHPFQDAWKSQSPLQRAPCSSPCMGCWRMRRRKRSAGSCVPICRQRSWSHSLMAICLRGGKRIRFLKREREDILVVQSWPSPLSLHQRESGQIFG